MSESIPFLDHAHLWHPFTQQLEWCEERPLVIDRAEGTDLFDDAGRRYIDGVSSLWCNVHGHHHPLIDAAVREQLDRVAHYDHARAHPPGRGGARRPPRGIAPPGLERVFFSESGSTAVEIALKMAFQYWHQVEGERCKRTRFVTLEGAYHGDTLGSVSVGGIDLFHGMYGPLLFKTYRVAPGDGRKLERLLDLHAREIAAVVVEPLVQGAAGIVVQPPGFLRLARELTAEHGVPLIADEVATGFGRTGTMFACEQERVAPDFLCLGKGLTGGYLPLAATLTTERVYEGFLGAPEDGPQLLSRPHVHRQPARVRSGAREPRGLRARGDAAAPAAEDPAARRAARRRRRRCRRLRKSAGVGSWPGSTSASTTRRCGSATG